MKNFNPDWQKPNLQSRTFSSGATVLKWRWNFFWRDLEELGAKVNSESEPLVLCCVDGIAGALTLKCLSVCLEKESDPIYLRKETRSLKLNHKVACKSNFLLHNPGWNVRPNLWVLILDRSNFEKTFKMKNFIDSVIRVVRLRRYETLVIFSPLFSSLRRKTWIWIASRTMGYISFQIQKLGKSVKVGNNYRLLPT